MRTNTAVFLIGCSCFLNEAFADNFETESWPGEGIPVLISSVGELTVRHSPYLDSPIHTIDYMTGWRVPFDKSLYRTIKPTVISVQQTATVEIRCDETVNYDFEAGQEIVYLQYSAEGYGTARVADMICEIPIRFEKDVFGSDFEEPVTQWWVRVTYGDGTSPGWLNVMDGQVSFGDREF